MLESSDSCVAFLNMQIRVPVVKGRILTEWRMHYQLMSWDYEHQKKPWSKIIMRIFAYQFLLDDDATKPRYIGRKAKELVHLLDRKPVSLCMCNRVRRVALVTLANC